MDMIAPVTGLKPEKGCSPVEVSGLAVPVMPAHNLLSQDPDDAAVLQPDANRII